MVPGQHGQADPVEGSWGAGVLAGGHPRGRVLEPAHGQAPGTMVAMALFLVRPGGTSDSASPVASAEIDEVEWVTSADADRCPPAGRETLRRLVAADLID